MKATTKILVIFFFFLFSFFARPVAADVSEEDVREVLAQLVGRSDRLYSVSIVDELEANAYASQGGNIRITRPMMTLLENRDQLAFILSHEVAHIWLSHIPKRIEKDGLIRKIIWLGQVIFVKNPDIWTPVVGEVAHRYFISTYSRDQEREADIKMLNLLVERGFDPRGGVAALERMREALGEGGGWFSTHPGFSERIARVREKAEKISPPPSHLHSVSEGGGQTARPVPTPIQPGAGRVILKNSLSYDREIYTYWYDLNERPRKVSVYQVKAHSERAVDFTPDVNFYIWLPKEKNKKGAWSPPLKVREGETIVFEVP